MKKISFANDFHEIKSIFDGLRSGQEEVILWQKNDDRRLVRFAFLEKNLFEQKALWFKAKTTESFTFTKGVMYCYVDGKNIVFKTNLGESDGAVISVAYPTEVTLLEAEDPMTSDIMIIKGHGEGNFTDITRVRGNKDDAHIDGVMRVRSLGNTQPEEEEKFAAMRASQRVQPKEEKQVTLVRDGKSDGSQYRLLDLSQGGAGLVVNSETEFTLKDVVNIVAIDGKSLDKVLRGEVVAIRPHNVAKNEFKLGIKFY